MDLAIERARLPSTLGHHGRRRAILFACLAHGALAAWLCLPPARSERPAARVVPELEVIFQPASQAPEVANLVIGSTSLSPSPARMITADLPASLGALRLAAASPAALRLRRVPPPARLPAERPPAFATAQNAAQASSPQPAPASMLSLAAFEGRISRAVQDAALYPPTARLMRRQGSAQVRFDYAEGTVSRVEVARPSPFPSLDEAALGAVRRAVLPASPPEIGGRKLTMVVWVRFALIQDD